MLQIKTTNKSSFVLYRNTFLVFLAMLCSIILASSFHPFKVDEVRLDIVFLVFQFTAFFLPFITYSVLVITFSFFLEMLSGSPAGFYALIYSLTLLGVIYFIRNNVYRITSLVFLFYLLITGFLKLLLSNLFLLNLYGSIYLKAFFKTGIKEFMLNFTGGLIIYFFIFIVKQLFNSLYTLIVRIKQL